jgi:uncharacterized glyoxalase superfamily protein PhnB
MPIESTFAHLQDNPSMPAATVIPVLYYPDVPVAAAWLCRAFGFTERLRIGGHRVQLNVGQGAVVIAQLAGVASGAETTTHSVMVLVSNVNQHFEHTRKAGAKILAEPASFPYGERQYSVVDLAGHTWTFSQSEFSVDPSNWGGQSVQVSENAA